MNDTMEIPRWTLATIVAPLIILALINGLGMYYGQQGLREAVASINTTLANAPTKPEVKAKYDFLDYRLHKIEKNDDTQDGRISNNHDLIMELKRRQSAIWQPPAPFPDGRLLIARFAFHKSPALSLTGMKF